MENVTVPQFIDSEDKILGPVTVRQFLIMLVACLFIFIAYKTSDFTMFLFITILILGVTGMFGFYKVNGQPFHFFVLHILQTTQRPSLRVWKKDVRHADIILYHKNQEILLEDILESSEPKVKQVHLSEQRLTQLSLVVDTGGGYKPQAGEDNELF